MQKDLSERMEVKAEKRRIEQLVSNVTKEFERRQKERLAYERQWELNMNFFTGNQYCDLNKRGEVVDEDKTFYWQNRGVFNHIAPIIESRLAKFSSVNPTVYVRPKSDDDKDVVAASVSEKIIAAAFKETEFSSTVKKVTAWSETCGSGFYKVVWDNNGGEVIGAVDGQDVYEGDVRICAVSPFEIFPDNLFASSVGECGSIMHARAVPVREIKAKYGVNLIGEEIGVFSLKKTTSYPTGERENSVLKDSVLLIEEYVKPTTENPKGKLIVTAGGKLLYEGDLPYCNGENKERTFPFVKQDSITVAGNFFGISVIERLIPVQRAYNAVKNRKHEFLNRLSMGIMKVEDGSVDVDDLTEEGLSPGKVLVYRQGSNAPEMMSDMSMPSDFNEEEDKLINEFVIVSGVSDVSSSSKNANLSSASALEMLVEQDNSRMLSAAESIRNCYLEVARQVIRLFSQFTAGGRTVKYFDGLNKAKIYYVDERAVSSDDVYLESENELLYSNSQKKDMIFKLYESGLLTDDEGKLRPETKEKILTLLGYKDLDYLKGISRLQEEKAQKENEQMRTKEKPVEEIDDDAIHIDEHVRYVLSEYDDLNEEQKQRFYAHIKAHKERTEKVNGE